MAMLLSIVDQVVTESSKGIALRRRPLGMLKHGAPNTLVRARQRGCNRLEWIPFNIASRLVGDLSNIGNPRLLGIFQQAHKSQHVFEHRLTEDKSTAGSQ